MADAVDMREDGEIESDGGEEEVYTKIERPLQEANMSSLARDGYKSDPSSSSESESEIPHKKFMKNLVQKPHNIATSASRSKNGSLWKNMIQEESLMENLKTCDVSSRKRKFERGAESYDFETHRVAQRVEDHGVKNSKRRKMEFSGNDSSSSRSSTRSGSSKSGRQIRKQRYQQRKRAASKILPDLAVTLEGSEEDFARDLAVKLEEEKCDLIVKVVSVIGKDASLNLYKITQKIEREGGMMTMNKHRRRTPGGVFLFLLKTSDKIDEDLKLEVFESDRKPKGVEDRKMSSDHTEAKDPPNSPANAEFHEVNGKVTDPDLVSQKILNFTKPEPSEEILELDYNHDDMDTF